VLRLAPGDPAALVLGDLADEGARRALRAALHLDESLGAQYVRYLGGLVTGDLGPSLHRPGEGAFARVGRVLPATAALASIGASVGAAAGVALGVALAGPWLGALRAWALRALVGLAAVPLLAFAPLATYALAVRLRAVPLPGDPQAGAGGLLFASALLGLPLAVHVARVTRAVLREAARSPFLTAVRAKGGGEARVWWVHALPASCAPVVGVVGTQLGALLGGAVVLERLFERPGLGTLMLESYAARDLPVLEASVVVAGALFVATQAAASAAHGLVDPRARGGG
jgi:peptide/nickel transport system permease protein